MMTTSEYAQLILEVKKESSTHQAIAKPPLLKPEKFGQKATPCFRLAEQQSDILRKSQV